MNSNTSWEYDGKPCSGLEQCMMLTKEDKECSYGICIQSDGSMQVESGTGSGPYWVQIQIKQPDGFMKGYTSPEAGMSWVELVKIMSRYESGEDFSFVQQDREWECTFDSQKDKETEKKIFRIMALIIGAVLALFLVIFFGNP